MRAAGEIVGATGSLAWLELPAVESCPSWRDNLREVREKLACAPEVARASAPDPRTSTRTVVVGLPPVWTACAFLSSLCGLKLVPSKWRCPVPLAIITLGRALRRDTTQELTHTVGQLCLE